MRTSLLALFLLPTIAMAAEPLHHQGRLLDAAGGPINGVRAVEFSLTSEAGATLWTDTLTVRLEDGYYSVELGDSDTNEIPDSALAADPWLDIAVDGSPLRSRMRLGAVPMARVARSVAGGIVDASEIRVDGQPIVDTDGRITGAITPESLRGLGCGTNELVLRGPGGWSCVPMDVFVPSNQSCPSGQKVTGVSTDGVITCAPDIDTNTNTTYDGTDFALSNRSCPSGQKVTGVASNGVITCAPDVDTDTNTTYDGSDFALSNRACPSGQKVTGVASNGVITCAPDVDTNTTYNGSDFALSNRACPSGQKVTGVASNGVITCAPDVDTNTTYNGSDFALSNRACPSGQKVTGVASNGVITCAPDINTDTNTTYDGTDFALSNRACPSGQKVTGIASNGVITCAPDIDTNTNTTYDGGDFALSNRFCGADQFMNGINSNGTPRCSTLDSAVNSYIRNHCWIHFGWRDSIDGGNSAPSKYGRVQVSNGSGTPGCASAGADNDCLQYTLHSQNTRLFALNTDGDVNGDDKFYIGMYCIP